MQVNILSDAERSLLQHTGTAADGYEYNPDYQYDEGGEYAEESDSIAQEDYWKVINSFFDEKGLVRQQLESFNEFVENTMQELVDESSKLTLDQHTQHTGVAGDETVSRGSLLVCLSDWHAARVQLWKMLVLTVSAPL